MIFEHARAGAPMWCGKRWKPPSSAAFDEEIAACEGPTASPQHRARHHRRLPPPVAGIGQSLTRRGRNSSVRLLTGHDVAGFADHDWKALAAPGEVAAIYMGKRAARFVQGRLLMHGADPATPVTVVENAGRMDQRVIALRLVELEPGLTAARVTGPALILYGLAPRAAETALSDLSDLKEAAR